jgi:hypothetical protein
MFSLQGLSHKIPNAIYHAEVTFPASNMVRRVLFPIGMCLIFIVSNVDGAACAQSLEAITPPPKVQSRLEDDKNFPVPSDRAEMVWRALRQKFKNGFTVDGESFRTVVSVERFSDEYFDSSDLKLVNRWVSLRHRKRVGENGAKKQLIQVKITPFEGSAPLDEARNERKFEVASSYNERGDFLERVKKKDVQRFNETMKELGVAPNTLVPSMVITQERRRVYFRKGDVQYFTATLDLATGNRWPFHPKLTQLEFEISEKVNTAASEHDRLVLQKLRSEIIRIAGIDESAIVDPRPKVVHMFDEIFSRRYGPLAKVYIFFPWLFPLGVAVGLLCALFVAGKWFVPRKARADGIR